MKNNECNCKGSHSQNSFMWGMIIGGLIVFLLVTKKGRRVLKAISEEGFEKLGEYVDINKLNSLKESFEDEIDEDEFEGVEEVVKEQNNNPKKPKFFRRKKN